VALLAVGTGLEWLTRRFGGVAARTAARAAGRAATRALIGSPQQAPARTSRASETVIDEFIYVRKVELRQ
jgi:hypothetical protein